jgi:16S rRNA (cytosine1402-N4)-methyltransferase
MSGHAPVMLAEVLTALRLKSGDVIVDGTFGGGGYTRAILAHADCKVIGLDRDPDAIMRGKALEAEMAGRFEIVETQFSKMDEIEGRLTEPSAVSRSCRMGLLTCAWAGMAPMLAQVRLRLSRN